MAENIPVVPKPVLVTAVPFDEASDFHLKNVRAEAQAIQSAFGYECADVLFNISVAELDAALEGRKAWYFAGHGDARLQGEDVLAFATPNGLQAVSINTLVSIVRRHVLQGSLEYVVLAGCCTLEVARALQEQACVPQIMCWETLVHDEAGMIFGQEFSRTMATSSSVQEAFEAARKAVHKKTESGYLDTLVPCLVQKFELDVDPRDRNLVDRSGRLIRHLGIPGPIAAGTPRLLLPDDSNLRGPVPLLPTRYQHRPEQGELVARLIDGKRQQQRRQHPAGMTISIVGFCESNRDTVSPVSGISGTAGLGKTTTAIAIARDTRTRVVFRDAVVWLEFGQQRTAYDRLCRFAVHLGVEQGQIERFTQKELEEAVSDRLSGKHMLVILDDVWNSEQPKPFQRLSRFGLFVLVTTRQGSLLQEELSPVPLRPLDRAAAMRLLAAVALSTIEELQQCPSLDQLIKLCAGLPALIQSVGVMLRKQMRRDSAEQSAATVLQYFRERRLLTELQTKIDEAENYQNSADGNLFIALELQLNGLKEKLADYCGMLAVFPEDTRVPLPVLSSLWNVHDKQARVIVAELADHHLIEEDRLHKPHLAITILDPVRDYLRYRGKNSLASWHAQLLSRCKETRVPDIRSGYWSKDQLVYHARGGGDQVDIGAMPHLTGLYLDMERIDGITCLSLADFMAKGGLMHCLHLHLRTNCIGDEGARALSAAFGTGALPNLAELYLSGNNISNIGVAALADTAMHGFFRYLRELGLSFNAINDIGAQHLATAASQPSTFPQLKLLFLGGNQIGEEGIRALTMVRDKGAFPSLKGLEIKGMPATPMINTSRVSLSPEKRARSSRSQTSRRSDRDDDEDNDDDGELTALLAPMESLDGIM